MNPFSLFHVADSALERAMLELFAADGPRTALQIAHIAEFDSRRLYAQQGYASMFEYCVDRAHLSDDAALKRIRAARAAREHPALFQALAEGRLHLTAVVLLSPHLADADVDELIAEATHRTVAEIKALLARHFPQPDLPLAVTALAPASEVVSKPPADAVVSKPPGAEVVSKPVVPAPRPIVAPLGPERYGVRFTMGQATHEAMRSVERLLGRRVTSADMDEALGQGFKAMAAAIEKRKFAATDHPRARRKPSKGRHIPAELKRQIRQRDQGRCTFVAESGRRCEARSHLEFDHIEPVARGGKATLENLRLRCRAHNQYEAERAFGAGFMHQKRERARRTATRPPARSAPADGRRPDAPQDTEHDVTPWLMRLGFRRAEARQAAAQCEGMPEAPLEERVKAALSFLRPPARVGRVAIGPGQPPRYASRTSSFASSSAAGASSRTLPVSST